MKIISGIMSNKSKEEYLESARSRYPSRNRTGKSKMIDEVSDALGWNRKHAIKALNGQVSFGVKAKKRGSKPTYQEAKKQIIIALWELSEQPCGKRLKQTLPLWLEIYKKHHERVAESTRVKTLHCSERQLDRITAPHRVDPTRRYGRSTGRALHQRLGT